MEAADACKEIYELKTHSGSLLQEADKFTLVEDALRA
jgi:hypothetical protein